MAWRRLEVLNWANSAPSWEKMWGEGGWENAKWKVFCLSLLPLVLRKIRKLRRSKQIDPVLKGTQHLNFTKIIMTCISPHFNRTGIHPLLCQSRSFSHCSSFLGLFLGWWESCLVIMSYYNASHVGMRGIVLVTGSIPAIMTKSHSFCTSILFSQTL